MKKIKFSFVTLAVVAAVLVGCSTFPVAKSPSTGEYAMSNTASNAIAAIAQLNREFVPAPFNGAVDAALGMFTIASLAYARFMNSKAAKQAQAADLLAAHVVKTSAQSTVLQSASGTPAFNAVAQHIDNNTI